MPGQVHCRWVSVRPTRYLILRFLEPSTGEEPSDPSAVPTFVTTDRYPCTMTPSLEAPAKGPPSLPNFLGIGAQRCGTSWLHDCLARHPQVYVPSARKEVHYFDHNYDRGVDWYRSFFRGARATHRAVGEITPKYMLLPECRDRIAETLGTQIRLIAVLRDPVARAFSQYTAFAVSAGRSQSFEAFLDAHPDVLERGYYVQQLKHFAQRFPLGESLLVLIHEEVHQSKATESEALDAVCGHLRVDGGSAQVRAPRGQSVGRPTFPRLLQATEQVRNWLRRRDQDWIVTLGKRLGVRRLFYVGRQQPLPKLSEAMAEHLREVYRGSNAELADWLGRRLPW